MLLISLLITYIKRSMEFIEAAPKSSYPAKFLLNRGCFIAGMLLALATCLQQISNRIASNQ